MSIKKDESSNTFCVSYSKRHPVTGKPIQLKRIGIKTRVEAQRVQNELVVAVNDKIKQKIIPKWSQVVSEYFKSLPLTGVTDKTIYNREKIINFHTVTIWFDRFVDEIQTDEIVRMITDKSLKYSEAHRKNILACIRKVFEFALGKEYVNRNPTPILRFKINDKIKSVLTEQQIIRFLKLAQDHEWEWYPHCATAVYTGMRNGELYALTWDNVDLDRRLIKVDSSWNNKDGFKSTKSGDDRVLEIPTPLMPLLIELKLKSADSNFVLPRLSKWNDGEQARELRIFMKLTGLPELRFHDLRATWATWLLSKGVAPSKVMAQGGWREMKTMMIYMRKAGIDIQGSTSVLDDIQTHGQNQARVVELSSWVGS